jgi:hypothetical protein
LFQAIFSATAEQFALTLVSLFRVKPLTIKQGKEAAMCEFSCDFSLQSERSRQAKVGDRLVTHEFGIGTRGFAAIDDVTMAVRLLPGTELTFAGVVACLPSSLLDWKMETIKYQTAIFRRTNKDRLAAHDDALEFPDGRIVPLTLLHEGQTATVLQLPAPTKTGTEVRTRDRVGLVA